MAFVLKQSSSYSWPVSVKLPADGGKFEKQTFDAQLLVGWSGVVDGDGDEILFSETLKEQLLDIPTVAAAIIVAYFDSLTGSKAKN